MLKYILALFIAVSLPSFAASTKPPIKTDCSLKKNAGKIECKSAPKSSVKPDIKKPPKVTRKAPDSVKKKADAANAKK